MTVLSTSEKRLALSALSLRDRARDFPEELAIASDVESFTKAEFSKLVNHFATLLRNTPKQPTFLPVLVGTNISSVIVYHAAILARIPVALIDANINPTYLEKILAKLENPTHIIISDFEYSTLVPETLIQIEVGRERQIECDIPDVDLTDAALVIFSSGSTGEPKGSIWSWKNLDDSFVVMSSYYPDELPYRLARVTSIAYAAGAYQMLSASLNHNLHLMNPKGSPDELIEFVNKNRLAHLSFSSSFAERIYDQRSDGLFFEGAIEILTYGEAVSWEQIRKLRELTRGTARIRASYGASESPGFTIYHLINPETPLEVGRVPIGLISELDDRENIEFIPNPEDPEIKSVVIKNFVATGYLGEPELTAEKFKINDSGERTYHTGDLVRINEKGVISFVGRGDDLVKINGRLVGPGESEALLRVLPGVINVAVLPHVSSAGKNFLAAHLVIDEKSELTPSAIYEYLLANLSSHLVPSQLVRHTELPLNANGKVDRKALIGQQWPRWRDVEKEEILTVFERFALAQLRRILKSPDLTASEDIFGSGMDSLAALEFEAIAAEFGYRNITPAIFLEHRTVKAIGRFLEGGKPAQESNFVTLNRTGKNSPYFLLPGAGVSAIFFKEFADFLGADQPVIVIEPQGMHTTQPVEQTLEEMASTAAKEIMIRQPAGEVHLIGHSAGAAIAIELGIQLNALGRPVKMISLDATGVANRVAMSPNYFKLQFLYYRAKSIITRSPQRMLKTIQRRQKAANRDSYEFFTVHIGKLTIYYKLRTTPTFPILFLYCEGKVNEKFWSDGPLFTYKEIKGEHFTMLNREYLPDVTSKIRTYFA